MLNVEIPTHWNDGSVGLLPNPWKVRADEPPPEKRVSQWERPESSGGFSFDKPHWKSPHRLTSKATRGPPSGPSGPSGPIGPLGILTTVPKNAGEVGNVFQSSNGAAPIEREPEVCRAMYHREPKYFWTNPNTSDRLSAGGIIFYDAEGMWLIEEKIFARTVYTELTDIGGKYNPDDGDIYATIARELGEETYHSVELTRRQVAGFVEKYQCAYLSEKGVRIYMCVLVDCSELERLGIKFDPEEFDANRKAVIAGNPMVPETRYPSVKLRYVPYKDLKNERLSKRLSALIRLSSFFEGKVD